MSEFRRDSLRGFWVVIAPERAARPRAFQTTPTAPDRIEDCPFCPGHEAMTPPPVYTVPGDGEYISVFIDTDNSKEYYTNAIDWNSTASTKNTEMFLYWPETSSFNETASIYSINAGIWSMATTLNGSDVTVGMGFESTINGAIR